VRAMQRHFGPFWPYVVLIAIPSAGFILPDVFGGHLLLTGDNLHENYPLHVLVGSMLRHGDLPFWNPYIFSGSPLLGGFNAGAFYPLVGLFVILPDRVAWIATEVILFSGIAIGMYVFLCALTLSTIACLLAAVTFSFSGVVLSQVNHVDMTEGFVAIPWMLLSVLHIVRDGRWRWSLLLGVGFALVILGGAPEAMLDEALLVIAYAAISAGFDWVRWWRVVSRCCAGAVLALSLAAIQWLPGLSAIAASQRSGLSGGFTASGSFPPKYGLLSLVPYLYGGFGHLGERTFFSHYNLPEVGIYVGILPVIALLALWHPRWPSRLVWRERFTWYAVALWGLLLALGAHTPLEHLFDAIPYYGQQRLQSRNMIDVSVAVCVLFAGWIDRRADGGDTLKSLDRWAGAIPLGAVLGITIWAISDPNALILTLTTGTTSPSADATVREAAIIALAFCVVAGGIVWSRAILKFQHWIVAVALFMVVDLGLMAGTSQLVTVPPNAVVNGNTSVERDVATHLAPGGRFDVYDPQGYSNTPESGSGSADENLLAQLPSVAGYSSIVNGYYNSLTLTHTPGELNIPLLGAGKLNELDLQDIVTLPEYFLVPLSNAPIGLADAHQASEAGGADPALPLGSKANYHDTAYPYYPPPRGALKSGRESSWFFGELLQPTRATLLLASPGIPSVIRFGTIGSHGAIGWGSNVDLRGGARSVTGALPGGEATGLVVQVVSGQLPKHLAVISEGGRPYELEGSLSTAVHPGAWDFAGSVQGYSLFVRKKPPTPIYAISSAGQGPPRLHVLTNGANTESVRVEATRSFTIVRDVAWDGGWQAMVSVNGTAPRKLSVTEHGLVQQVRVPPGRDVLTFRYLPPHLLVASVLSLGALLFLAVVGIVAVLRHRRLRRSAIPSA